MSWKLVKELKEKRAQAHAAAVAIRDNARKETRDLTAAELEQHDRHFAEVEKLGVELEREERSLALGSVVNTVNSFTAMDVDSRANSLDMPAKDFGKYSLVRAIRMRMNNQQLDGIEGEVSAEIAKRCGKNPQGFYMPMESRVLNTTTGAGAVPNPLGNDMIELLRAKTLVAQLGATYLTNLVGGFKLPRQSGGATAYWVAESGSPTASNVTVDQVAFAAKTVGAFTDISRQFVNQTGIDAENMVRNDITTVLAIAIDTAALNGSGTSNQPTGILNTGSIPTAAIGTNGGAESRAHILSMARTLEEANAIGTYKYVTTPANKAKMKLIDRGTDTGKYLWSDDDTVEGFDGYSTNLMPKNLTKGTSTGVCSASILGNFADLVVGFWGGLDILVDPYTGSSSGTVRIVALQDCDIQLRHLESFVVTKDYTTT